MSALDEELAALEAEDEAAEKTAAEARAEQAKVDRVAYLKLKKSHTGTLGVLQLETYRPGWPTSLVVSSMDGAAFNRFEEMSQSKSKEKKRQAIRCAVSDCLLYPTEAAFAAMVREGQLTELPGAVALEAVRLSRAKATSEGKE